MRVYETTDTAVHSDYAVANGGTTRTVTLQSDFAKTMLLINTTTGATIDVSDLGIQIELGSTATAFEPYQGQSYPISLGSIELCGLGDDGAGGFLYQDGIYKSDGKWYVHKEVGKFIYSGANSESWQKFEYGGVTLWRATTLPTGMISSSITSDLFKSNNYDYWVNDGTSVSTALQNGQFGFNGTATNINFKYSGVSELTDWVAWLSSHPTTVYYALATPTDTEITNSTLIEQLEAILAQGRTYGGINNITTVISAGNAQGELEIGYYTDKAPDVRDEIVIDSRLRTVTLNGLDIYHLIAEGSEFLMLAPGENRLSLQSDITGDNGYAQVSYKQGYLSI